MVCTFTTRLKGGVNSPIKALSDSNSEFFWKSLDSFLNYKSETEKMEIQRLQYISGAK